MTVELKLETNVTEVLQRFERLPKEVQTAVKKGLGRALLLIETKVRQSTGVKLSGARSGLSSRLTSYVETPQDGKIAIDGAIGFRVTKGFPYELSQEFGAKAKPGKAMSIPVSPEAKRLNQLGQGPRDFPGKLFIPRNRHVLSAYSKGAGQFVVHYVLVKSIRPRLKFVETVMNNIGIIDQEVGEAAQAI
jgi:hypothetical protein